MTDDNNNSGADNNNNNNPYLDPKIMQYSESFSEQANEEFVARHDIVVDTSLAETAYVYFANELGSLPSNADELMDFCQYRDPVIQGVTYTAARQVFQQLKQVQQRQNELQQTMANTCEDEEVPAQTKPEPVPSAPEEPQPVTHAYADEAEDILPSGAQEPAVVSPEEEDEFAALVQAMAYIAESNENDAQSNEDIDADFMNIIKELMHPSEIQVAPSSIVVEEEEEEEVVDIEAPVSAVTEDVPEAVEVPAELQQLPPPEDEEPPQDQNVPYVVEQPSQPATETVIAVDVDVDVADYAPIEVEEQAIEIEVEDLAPTPTEDSSEPSFALFDEPVHPVADEDAFVPEAPEVKEPLACDDEQSAKLVNDVPADGAVDVSAVHDGLFVEEVVNVQNVNDAHVEEELFAFEDAAEAPLGDESSPEVLNDNIIMSKYSDEAAVVQEFIAVAGVKAVTDVNSNNNQPTKEETTVVVVVDEENMNPNMIIKVPEEEIPAVAPPIMEDFLNLGEN